MLGRMDELMRGLKEVSDNIAHDLKTPLTRLRNRVESTLAGEPSVERYREALEATITESDGLIQTFNALLLIARVEAGSATAALTETDLSATVADAVELYDPVAEEAGVTLTATIEPGVTARASRELIAQAVTNLIDNALKYGRPDTSRPLAVTVHLARDAGGVRIEVSDNGPGIPAADRERVLGRFVRLEASRNAPGSGLGLALVNAVAHLHGGSVALSDAGPGLRVTMRWPG
jgi:signal transduction histidine kinase